MIWTRKTAFILNNPSGMFGLQRSGPSLPIYSFGEI